MELPKTYLVPFVSILNQGVLPACTAYAIATVANAQLKAKGIDDTIDPVAYFSLAGRPFGTKYDLLLDVGKEQGIPSVKGHRYKIWTWDRVPTSSYQRPHPNCRAPHITPINPSIDVLKEYIMKYSGVIFTLALRSFTKNFIERIDPKTHNLEINANDTHALALVGWDIDAPFEWRVANSWADFMNSDKGFFDIPYVGFQNGGDVGNVLYFKLDI